MKRLIIAILLIMTPGTLFADPGVSWLPLDKAIADGKTEKKYILIDFYAPYCGYCKLMKKETYANPRVAEVINRNFKATSVDIEGDRMFTINGKTLSESSFAEGFGVRATPTTWFLKPNGDLVKGIPGYLEADEFIDLLKYIGEGWHEKMDIVEYLKKRPAGK